MTLTLKPGTSWSETYSRCLSAAPEAFGPDHLRNLANGEWSDTGRRVPHLSPIDGTAMVGPSVVDAQTAVDAIHYACGTHRDWSRTPLRRRLDLVGEAVALMAAQRDLLALLLVHEIGKPWRLALADVDRCLDGVRWYIEVIEDQLAAFGHPRGPLPGPVSNIASWNYPMSVQIHAELVQLLCGNAVVAKTPSQGGFHCLTLAHALLHRVGLPVTLLSGEGAEIGEALVRTPGIGAIAFVGGRATGRRAAISMADPRLRHIYEQEGLNALGVWDYSDWDTLTAQITKSFEYAKQRCTAYPRFVVQRGLFPDFYEAYRRGVAGVRFGNPLAVAAPDDPLPELTFGPVINAAKAARLRGQLDEALGGGAVPLHLGSLNDAWLPDDQDAGAYSPPACVLAPATSWSLHHSEPFGPLDSVVIVDSEAELIGAMNISNGSLVATISTDDLDFAEQLRTQIQAFKVGINTLRSRGDREEVFGGLGQSWNGAFVGGELLVQALTYGPDGPDEDLYGNYPARLVLPRR
jgi:acyl-CoA reductase-like NAD-dependent aldehyde dehydrogenase